MKENKVIKWAKENKKCVITGIAGAGLTALCVYAGYKFHVGSVMKGMSQKLNDNLDDGRLPNEIVGKITGKNGELIANDNIWAEQHGVIGMADDFKLTDMCDVMAAVTLTMKKNFPDYDYDNGHVLIEFMKKSE